MKKFVFPLLAAIVILKAGAVTFAGKTFNTVTYKGRECVTLVEFASKTSSRFAWVAEKKKAVLRYNDHTYVFTASNRTVVIDEGAVHIPEPIEWDGVDLYIPVRMLERIFNVSPAQIRPPDNVRIEKIILSGADPTTIQILASGPISCEVTENSATSVTLKVPVGCNIKEIAASGLVSSASLRNNDNRTTIDLRLSKDCAVSSRGITNGVEVTFASRTQAAATVTRPSSNTRFVIVIDPGHGGKDPGAVGARGIKESDMNLDVSKRLKPLLEAQGHTVYLTRSSDTYMALADRTKFANQKKADLFISIHFNANNSSAPSGFESYFLGMHRLEYAKNVALAENAALKYDIANNAYNPDETLNDIIGSLLTNRFQRQSEILAGYIQEKASLSTGFSNRGVNQAGFYVLKGCSMPSVLLECGFLTNSSEEAKIRQPSYRQKIAEGIVQGVARYIEGL